MNNPQAAINKLNQKLYKLDKDIRGAAQRNQIELLKKERREIEEKLMALYGTEKYGLV